MSADSPKVRDYLFLLTLASFWGTSFLFTKTALTDFGPVTVAGGRVTVAAVVLAAWVLVTGQALPRDRANWTWAILGSLSGTLAPFALIAWGQQFVDSSLAAVLMATTPLATLVLAHMMTEDERLNWPKLIGMVLGFSGIIVVVGNVTVAGAGLVPPLAILGGAVGYAASGIFLRRLRGVKAAASGSIVMGASAVILLPAALILEQPWTVDASPLAILSLLELGLLPSALAVVMVVILLSRTSATFVSLNNYIVPMIGILVGALFLDESLNTAKLGGFALIIAGVGVSSRYSVARRPAMQADR